MGRDISNLKIEANFANIINKIMKVSCLAVIVFALSIPFLEARSQSVECIIDAYPFSGGSFGYTAILRKDTLLVVVRELVGVDWRVSLGDELSRSACPLTLDVYDSLVSLMTGVGNFKDSLRGRYDAFDTWIYSLSIDGQFISEYGGYMLGDGKKEDVPGSKLVRYLAEIARSVPKSEHSMDW